ncbi:putative f-box and domain protein [Erysiphe necator]|uniref:Putative f-box and domain protein n=1 Tax=Uncinula necator TaxID=52586 RepID=A0A0B1P3B0_UNCNE|nr:putative f-box and domain protein [Erysiphe necator]
MLRNISYEELSLALMEFSTIKNSRQNSKLSIDSSVLVEPIKLVPKHPLGIRPLGNQYLGSINAKFFAGWFQILPEDLIASLLENLDPISLLTLGSTCTYLHAFCRWDNLWRTIFTESQNSRDFSFDWLNTWRSTYLNLKSQVESKPRCDNVFSDILYRPFFCTHIPLETYTSNIPQKNQISRLSNLSVSEYSKTWGYKPFILTHHMKDWPIFKQWNIEYLLKHYHEVKFQAEGVNWRLSNYIAYMKNNCDESPLYLFDKEFYEKMNLITSESDTSSSYWTPQCFAEDLFSVFGDERPDFRWLIIGPRRSGSTYHKDPNATSAWNAVIKGSKYWIMFPSTSSIPAPPGVYVSEDESEVTSPLSIAEWLLGFHAEARRTHGCIEGVCGEGEILHIPSGWWHLVVNLETTIALTQNFVPYIQLPEVIHFLKNKANQVSGFKGDIKCPYSTFIEKMTKVHPDLLQSTQHILNTPYSKKRKLVSSAICREESEKFTFSFYNDE